MKNIKIIVILVLLCSFNNKTIRANKLTSEKTIEKISLAEQIYNKLVISTRIVKYTNKYIDLKKKEKQEVPDIIWIQIKSSIDYSSFKNAAIQVLNNNLSSEQMERLIIDFSNNSQIPLPNLKIKKELYDLIPNFQNLINEKISQVLTENGYNS